MVTETEKLAAWVVASRKSLTHYMMFVHGWKVRPHQKELVKALEALILPPACWGKDHPICECSAHVCDACFPCRVHKEKRLLTVWPPGWGKTDTAIEFMCWAIGQDPEDAAFGFFSYNDNIATERAMAVRDSLWSKEPSEVAERYALVFPGLKPNPERPWSQERFFLWRKDSARKDPTVIAAGMTGSVNARRLRGFVLDDPHNQENSATPYQRGQVWTGYKRSMETRLTEDGWQWGITTRWEDDDWAGRVMNLNWPLLHTPALENEESTWKYEGPNLGFKTESLLQLREEDPVSFMLQYQGEFIDEGVATLRWPKNELSEFPHSYSGLLQSWDTAVGQDKQHSESCCTTWGWKYEDNLLKAYWLDTWTGQLPYTDLANKMLELYWRYAEKGMVMDTVLIEQASSGHELIPVIRNATAPNGQRLNIPVKGITVGGRGHRREERIAGASKEFYDNVYVPSDAEWKNKARQQVLSYRGAGKFRGRDDIVMSAIQAIEHIFRVRRYQLQQFKVRYELQ